MRFFHRLSYGRKLTLVLTLTSCATLTIAGIVFALDDLVQFRSGMVRDLEILSGIIGDNSTAALAFGDRHGAEEILQALRAKETVVSACIYDSSGHVFAGYQRDHPWDPSIAPPPGPDGHRFGRGRLALYRGVELDGEKAGTVYIESDLRELYARLREYAVTAALVFLGSAVFALLLSSRLQAVVSDPVLRLVGAARAVSAHKNYRVRVTKENDDELGLLTDSFNEMLEQIEARDAALRQAQLELEKRVEERTRELHRQVSERRQTEEALRQSEEQFRQAQKMEAVGRLAGGVAHDFNNLLTAILGHAQLMAMGLAEGDPLRGHAEEIQKASQRAAALTRQLLAFSRRQVLDPKVLDLNAVVGNMERMLRRVIGEDILLTCAPALDLGCVKADPGQLEQVLLNLVVNARDAMPSGGKLLIETANVELDDLYALTHTWVSPGRYVRLAVTDTGCGMDEATKLRVFEPFFTTKEKGKGTGLGLSMAYGIVKQSGGHILVYSEPGRGTTLKIYLPLVDDAVPEEATARQDPTGIRGGKEVVLLVEDDDMVRRFAYDTLRMLGYTVLEAPHGGEALLLCERYPAAIDLMVTDIVMPHLNGVELYERVARLRPEMRVLYMSGYTETGIAREGILKPGATFLEKPFSPDSLLRKVREILDEVRVG